MVAGIVGFTANLGSGYLEKESVVLENIVDIPAFRWKDTGLSEGRFLASALDLVKCPFASSRSSAPKTFLLT